MRALNGNTYELVNENLTNAQANAEKCENLSTEIVEYTNSIATLQQTIEENQATIENHVAEYTAAQNQIATLNTELEALRNYKHSIELQQKEAIFNEYADKLTEEVINTYKANIENYSVVDLDKELAYELKKTNSSIFAQQQPSGFVPKDVDYDGINAILSRYKK